MRGLNLNLIMKNYILKKRQVWQEGKFFLCGGVIGILVTGLLIMIYNKLKPIDIDVPDVRVKIDVPRFVEDIIPSEMERCNRATVDQINQCLGANNSMEIHCDYCSNGKNL
jgi:hypothetical protein